MNRHSFYATLQAHILLIDAEFDFIFSCMEKHYDFTIKQATKQGGFMYGLKNRRTRFYPEEIIDDESRTIDVSNRELQLLIKSMEMYNDYNIQSKLSAILSEMIQKQNELNKTLNK
jgi:hypothetical protein